MRKDGQMRRILIALGLVLVLAFSAQADPPTLINQASEDFFYTASATCGDSYATLTSLLDTTWGGVQEWSLVGRALISVTANHALLAVGVGADGHPLYVGDSYYVQSRAEFAQIYVANATPGSNAVLKVTIRHTMRQ